MEITPLCLWSCLVISIKLAVCWQKFLNGLSLPVVADNTCLGSQITEKDTTLESEGQVSNSDCGARKVQSDCVGSVAAFDGTQIDGGKENPIYDRSPSYCDNKSSFSSTVLFYFYFYFFGCDIISQFYVSIRLVNFLRFSLSLFCM